MQDIESFLSLDENILQQLRGSPFLFFSPTPLQMHFEDVIKQEEILEFHQVDPAPQLTIETIEIYYNETAANFLESEGSAFLPPIITHVSYPIHFAARDGKTDDIEFYTQQGFDVNQKDTHSITPLHVAALFGQFAAVKTLLSIGAKIDLKGYEGHTPLHFALMKDHFDVATLLIHENADPLGTDYQGNNAFTMIVDTLANEFVNYNHHPSNAKLAKINQIFNTIDAMITHTHDSLLYTDISNIKGEPYYTPIPGAIVFQEIAALASTKDLIDKTLSLTHQIQASDPSWQTFLYAKDLLHRFPTGEPYKIKLDSNKEKIWFSSEGHFGVFTTKLAANSLEQFIEQMDQHENDLKVSIFHSLKNIYDNANEYAQYANLPETKAKALALYNSGETILLPSGWDGHFVDVILSKSQALYVIANSGDRYHGEAPEYEPDPPGIIFYKLHEPDRISEKFIHKILTNVERMSLEYENPYEYGIIEKIDDIIRENQIYGNCGWESHRNAVEGLIYIELLNRNMPPLEAKDLANAYYEEWDQFHGNFVIDNYMAEPGLPFKAMLDMLQQIHLKTYFSETDHIHSQKIAETFLSSHYFYDFQYWVANPYHNLADRLMLNILQEQHGIDIHHLTSHLPEVNLDTDVIPMLTPPLIEELPIMQEILI